eukprot:7712586-Alexandrium_andersonii.AAC.1
MELVEPVRQKPGGVLGNSGHTPGGGIRRDEDRGRGIPLEPVGLLKVAKSGADEWQSRGEAWGPSLR